MRANKNPSELPEDSDDDSGRSLNAKLGWADEKGGPGGPPLWLLIKCTRIPGKTRPQTSTRTYKFNVSRAVLDKRPGTWRHR